MAFVPTGLPAVRCVRPSLVCSRSAVAVSAFHGVRVSTPMPKARAAVRMEFEISEGVEYELNGLVFLLAIAGWVIPSSIPAGIPLTNGTGLTQAFIASINANLANWPAGPVAADPFWTLCFMWHIGMFATMIFGSIGYNMRK